MLIFQIITGDLEARWRLTTFRQGLIFKKGWLTEKLKSKSGQKKDPWLPGKRERSSFTTKKNDSFSKSNDNWPPPRLVCLT